MADLMKLKLESILHKDYALWIDPIDGELLYGKDRENVFYPRGFEDTGRFPPLHLSDLREAFLLGKKCGAEFEREEKEKENESRSS